MSSSHSSGSSSGGRGMRVSSHAYPPPTALTPKSLLKRYKLPIAAHLHTPSAPPGLDLSRPLLLYNSYTSTKVRGISLRPGRDSSLTPVGPAIVIPDSYTGWFAIVTSDGHTAPFFSTIEQVANSQVAFFLTRYDVAGYTSLHEAENGRKTYQKMVIHSGHVLKLLGIFEDLNAKKTNSGGRGKDGMANIPCTKYAQCLNYRNEVVYLPFSASGRFYTTAHKNSKNPSHVYLMAHILKNHKLPITVRLVCGYMPRVPCSFTGVLRLEKAQKEAVILACTMTNEARATLFEIDVSSNFVLAPVKDSMFPKTPIYLKTVSYCEDEADAWRRQIKVTHHVTEKRSRSLSRHLNDNWVDSTETMSFAFLAEHDKKKGRGREKSRDRLRINDRARDKSRENILRDKSRERHRENPQQNKLSGKGQDQRKLSKQNTYIFQKDLIVKVPDKKQEADAISRLNKSIENLDYSRVIDDISPVHGEDDDEHYAEICEYIISKKESSSSKPDSYQERQRRSYDKENGIKENGILGLGSFDDDKNLSFTLLKKDIGGYYVKLPGFEDPRTDIDSGVYSDRERTYDSSC
ncbi:uncharacterized protein [Macrobrachium rosenbergii]|uniref:uncharacterized protein isoform X1 n=1 Tax=Macrobrachium rosenbergii TaxID=79674 RepID=UPI0034D70A36